MKKTILLISLLLVGIFLSGCAGLDKIISTTSQKDGGILDIELYDADGNLIGTSPTMAIVNTIPAVEFINIKSTMKNTGNIDLMAKLQIFAPPEILTKFKDNNVYCQEIHRDYVICASPDGLIEGQQISLQSGLVNVNEIGIGTHKLLAKATAQYTENGEIKYIESEKGFILTIEKDPIRAGISVEIGTSGITPPPPCRKICSHNMILNGELCIIEPPCEPIKLMKEECLNANLFWNECPSIGDITVCGTPRCETGELIKDRCVAKPQIICPIG